MKKIYICLSLLAVIVLGTACNNEWEDEQYEQYVSFKAPIASGSDGVTTIYVRYKDNGKVTYQLPIIVSGSTVNSQDRDIHIAALNFADAATPGGSVLYGAKTQEECLCRCSNLYESIISDKCDKAFYSKNLSNYHNTRKIIYSPDCVFFLDKDYIPLEDYIKCDIITSPAPFGGCADNEYIYTKMKDILIVASFNKVDKLILGMWGCGAFNNDLETFAYAWARAILEVKPTMNIVFANYSKTEDRPIEFYNAFMKKINRANNMFLHKNITVSF